jgi:hypothetical protein
MIPDFQWYFPDEWEDDQEPLTRSTVSDHDLDRSAMIIIAILFPLIMAGMLAIVCAL